MKIYRSTLTIIFLIFSLPTLSAQTFLPSRDVEIFIDSTNKTKVENLQQFKKNVQSIINIGNTRATIWLKIDLTDIALASHYLEVGNGMLDEVVFYHKNATGTGFVASKKIGGSYPKSHKYLATNALLFPIPETASKIYYLQVRSNFPVEIPLEVNKLPYFLEKAHKKDFFLGAYLGIMFVMSLYNLFVYFSVRDRVYLYYVLYVCTIGSFYLHLKGYMFDMFWGEMPALNFYTPVFSVLPVLSVIVFARKFLNTPHYIPRLDKLFWLFLAIGVFCIVGNIAGDYVMVASISQFFSLLTLLYVFFCAIFVHQKGNPLGRYFILAWSIYIGSVVIFILQVSGATPANEFTSNSVLYGTVAEVILLSFALAYRINLLKKENIRIIKEQNHILEDKVNQRTAELQELNQEIKAQNEELLQTQEELTAQRDFIELQKNKLEAQNTKIKSSIQASKIIQQSILTSEQKLKDILENYFLIYLPKDEVSGDFYWLNRANDVAIVACIDCTGHGVPGAFMTTIANSLLDRIVLVEEQTSPAQILTRLHELVYQTLRQHETTNNNGMDLAILAFKPSHNTMTDVLFAGAKANFYYSKENAIQTVKGARKSVGGEQNPQKIFENQTFTLPASTRLYLCTDGFADQNNERRIRIGEEEMLSILQNSLEKTLEAQAEILLQTLETQMQSTQQRDDILFLGFEL